MAQKPEGEYLSVGSADARTESYTTATGGAAAGQDLTKWITNVNRFKQDETKVAAKKIAKKSSFSKMADGIKRRLSKSDAGEATDENAAAGDDAAAADAATKKKDVDIVEFAYTPEECATRINEAGEKDKRMRISMKVDAFNEYSKQTIDLTTKLDLENEGLSAAAAEAILAIDGENVLTPPTETPWYILLLLNMVGGFSTLLWIASIMCFVAFGIQESEGEESSDNLALGLVLAFVVIATGLFSYLQEKQSSDVMKSFAKLVPQQCTVIRGGTKIGNFEASQLVEGDIVELQDGDRVPADIRVIQATNFKVDNASLTGESEAQKREIDTDLSETTANAPLEAKNIAFFTTSAVSGSAKGIVVRTGDRTVIGQIKELVTAGKADAEDTPIAKEIHHFIFLISSVAVALGVIFFIIALSIDYTFIQAIVFLIGIIVANVPEGLLATVTVCLTLTAQRMKVKSVLVKQLESVETLGSTSCICSDKTGTLTQNKMTVAHVFYGLKVAKVLEEMAEGKIGDEYLDEINNYEGENPAFKELWTIGQLNNVAVYNAGYIEEDIKLPFQERRATGNATDIGILKFCDRAATENSSDSYYDVATPGSVLEQTSNGFRVDNPYAENTDGQPMKIPFNSKNKFAGGVHQTKDKRNGDKYMYVLKGAPERIWTRCSSVLDHDGNVVEMTPERLKTVEYANERLGSQGERVIGFAMMYLDLNDFPKGFKFDAEDPFNGLTSRTDLTFVGLMALIDPPRPAVPAAVKDCQSGGIQVIMVTGDHPGTAKAIAKNIDIIKKETGEELAEADGKCGMKVGKKFAELPMTEQWEYHKKAGAQVVTGGELIDLSYMVDITNAKGEVTQERRYYVDADGNRFIDIILGHTDVVFARTSPAQKLEIVKAVQGEPNPKIVAVTGDGVNDSPALSAADIGVAMGIAGSDVSKDAADMILMNDDFSSIVEGVKEGRIVFDNLKKSIAYTLTSNIPEISPFLVFVIFQVPLPLSTVMILAIDLGTDMYPAISMAFEGPESDIMLRKPRDPKTENLVTLKLLSYTYLQIGIIQACAGFFCYFVVFSDCGFEPYKLLGFRETWEEEDGFVEDTYGNEWSYETRVAIEQSAQTSYFVSIVIVQWADLIICKTRVLSLFEQGMHNMPMNRALVFETCLGAAVCYIPNVYVGLKTRPLSFNWWLPALSFSALIFTYDEIRKYLMRSERAANVAKGLDPLEHPGFVERNTYY
jgi:sodium/potassium-transporting ATPase subunit alpha